MTDFSGMNRVVKKFEPPATATMAEAPPLVLDNASDVVAPDAAEQSAVSERKEIAEDALQQFVPDDGEIEDDEDTGGSITVKDKLDRVWENAPFMPITVDDDVVSTFASEYNPSLNTVDCVASRNMLLQYMVATERKYHVTLSFPAYGVDPIVFDEAVAHDIEEGNQPVISIPLPDSEHLVANKVDVAGDAAQNVRSELYEKIEVDDVLYLSCVSECLDTAYLHKVITEVTESLYMHGQYMYTLVGPRPLVSDSTPEEYGKFPFIETLKLNSYELSVLLAYARKMEGVEVVHGLFDGRSAILFRRV